MTARLALTGVLVFLLTAFAAPAAAQAAIEWQVLAQADSTAPAGNTLGYKVDILNLGDSPVDGSGEPWTFSGTLPAGFAFEGLAGGAAVAFTGEYGGSCTPPGGQSFSCTSEYPLRSSAETAAYYAYLEVLAAVPAGASGPATATFHVAGGDPSDGDPSTPSASTAALTALEPVPTFGIAGFDQQVSAGESGAAFSQAAGHPFAATTDIEFNTFSSEEPVKGDLYPVEPVRDIEVELPPGFLGNPSGVSRCTLTELTTSIQGDTTPLCSSESQVGVAFIRNGGTGSPHLALGPVPVFNMVPPPGAPARLAFNFLGTVAVTDIVAPSSRDYALTARSSEISEGLGVGGVSFSLWGVPASSVHDRERGCPGGSSLFEHGPTCASAAPQRPFLRQPTSCPADPSSEGLATTLRMDSWAHPGDFASRTVHSHQPNGYPWAESEWGPQQGTEGCGEVPFEPGLSAEPTTSSADSPTGLDLHLTVPQRCWSHAEEICSSDLRDAEVKLPQGMSLNPSAASGLGACTPAQIGVTSDSPLRFDEAPASCPDSAKLGTVQIETPPLEEPLTGSVYLAKQNDNPFGSLLAMYLVAEGSGVRIKQAGEIVSDPGTGRLTTIFREAPQQPFSDLHVHLFGGPRAALRTPPTCGTFALTARLTPWSGNAPVNVGSAFEIEQCPNSGFDPKLSAGTRNPLAGSFSPFSLRLTREDGTQPIAGLTAALPEGLLGKPAGIPYCPDSTLAAISGEVGTGVAQEQHPSCPAASLLGTVTAGAGAGAEPFFTSSGRAYLAGPYKGAPLSLAVITPAVAGPFDLGTVLVRNALRVDPETAQITAVSDPIPTILHGIPLDLRDIRVNLNRNEFTLNPTSCEPFQIGSLITSAQGATASPSAHFQAAACERLAFKPKLSLKLRGKTERTGFPALRAVYVPKAGNANLEDLVLRFPRSEFIEQGHFRTICTRVQFAANGGGGAGCPAGSVYGHIKASTPLLEKPLEGPVYLRSSDRKLPDVVFDLNGQIHLDVPVHIDSVNGGLRATLEGSPDAPLTKVVLDMQGGQKGLFVNSRDICAHAFRARLSMQAHNARSLAARPAMKASGCPKASKRHRRHASGR